MTDDHTVESNPTCASVTDDREAIVAHIRSIFDAYVADDLETIRATHTSDWRGFQIKSTSIVRGIEEHMKNAASTVEAVETISYELLDTDVQIFGDVAVVFYLARDVVRPRSGGESRTLFLRAADIYRREDGAWNQCGSNICLVPEATTWEGSAGPRPGH